MIDYFKNYNARHRWIIRAAGAAWGVICSWMFYGDPLIKGVTVLIVGSFLIARMFNSIWDTHDPDVRRDGQ